MISNASVPALQPGFEKTVHSAELERVLAVSTVKNSAENGSSE